MYVAVDQGCIVISDVQMSRAGDVHLFTHDVLLHTGGKRPCKSVQLFQAIMNVTQL